MNIMQAYKRVLKTKENIGSLRILEPLMYLFDVELDTSPRWHTEQRDNELVGYWLVASLDTDTWIGTVVYFLHDKPVMVAHQTGRRMNAKLFFVSDEAYQLVRDYVISFREESQVDPIMLTENSIEDLPDGRGYDRTDTIVDSQAIYKGQLLKVQRLPLFEPNHLTHMNVQVEGEWKQIAAHQLEFPLRIVRE
jgi:hypothetical protein